MMKKWDDPGSDIIGDIEKAMEIVEKQSEYPELPPIEMNECANTNDKENFTYAVTVWGGFFNDLSRHEYKAGTYFFNTKEERDDFTAKISSKAAELNEILATTFNEGSEVRGKTIASMTLEYGGEKYPIEYDFGFGYPQSSAHWMFFEGNYSCDCNRSNFISHLYPECGIDTGEDGFSECGETIEISEFNVYQEPDVKGEFAPVGTGPRLARSKG